MKKLKIILAMLMAVSIAGCSTSGATATESAEGQTENYAADKAEGQAAGEGAEIAMITDFGSIDDRGFNQGTWEGVKKYGEEKGISYKYYKPSEKTTDAYLSAIDLAVKGGAKVVVTPGFRFEEPVFLAQDAYPDVKFVLLDGIPGNETESYTADNAVGIKYAEEESGFLAGYAVVQEGYTKLGFMGGLAVPAVVRFGYGFIQGAEVAAKELGISGIEMNYYYTGTFDATPETQTLAATWYQNGTELIFSCGSGVCHSVMAAAEVANPMGKTIGVDIDWSAESETVLTSAAKSLQGTVYQMLDHVYNDSFPGGQNVVMDAASDGVELPMSVSRFNVFSQDDYDVLFKRLAEGEFTLLKDVDSQGEAYALTDVSDGTIQVIEVK